MTDGFVSYWSDLMNKPDNPFYEFAKKMIQTPKVVFTKIAVGKPYDTQKA